MVAIKRRAQAGAKKHWKKFRMGGILYAFDRARWHQAALPDLPIEGNQLFEIPPNSPDFNRVVEHMHHAVKERFHEIYSRDDTITEPKDAAMALLKAAYSVVTPQGVGKDVEMLPKVYASVISNEGGWAGKGLR